MVWRASGAVFRPYTMRLLIWRLLVRPGLRARKRRKKAQNRSRAHGPAPTGAAPAEAWRLELRTRLQPRAVARAATGLTNKVTHWSCSAAAPPQMARYQVLS